MTQVKQAIKTHRKWIRYLGCGLLLLSIILWLYFKLDNPQTLPIKNVDIRGNYTHVNHDLLQQALVTYTTAGFFNVDIKQIQAKLLTLPWIKQAEVDRVWPDTVNIKIIEQKVSAEWDKNALINLQGALFFPTDVTFPKDLPQLSGPKAKFKEVYADYLQAQAMLQPLLLTVAAVHMSANEAVSLTLSNGCKIILGQKLLWQRLQRFINVYNTTFANKPRRPVYIDLRYPNGMAVKWSAQKVT